MSNVEMFTTQNDNVYLEVTLEKETVWLSQAQMVKLLVENVLFYYKTHYQCF